MAQLGLQWTDFDGNWYMSFSPKICRESSSFITIR
jgi:hypothetical protein